MPRRIASLAAAAVLALATAGCGDDDPVRLTDLQASQGSVASASPSVPPPAPSPSAPAEALDAKAVVDALKAAGLPLTAIAEQDENTDPNDKLGRPGGYTSRASADVPGGAKNGDKYGIDRGLVVEVFATVEDADARSKYIQDTLKQMQVLGTEYHYRAADKRILVRLTGKVKPSQAKKFEAAVTTL